MQRAALDTRNRLATLLYERIQLVRTAARFVYRKQPDVVRTVTSAYRRKRVADYRRAMKHATEQAPTTEPTTGEVGAA
jgi:hypothetical protein